MAIQNGELPDADDITNLTGIMFKQWSNLLHNATLIGFDSDLDQEFDNLVYSSVPSGGSGDIKDTETDSTGGGPNIFGAIVMDDFEDASLDGNIWSTATSAGVGSVVESNGEIIVSHSGADGNQEAVADQVNAYDFRNGDSNSTAFVKVTEETGTIKVASGIYLTDGATDVQIMTPANITAGKTYKLIINPGADTCQWTDNVNATSGTSIDISGLGNATPWYIAFKVDTDNPNSGTLGFAFVRYLENAAVAKTFISGASSPGVTVTDAILTVNSDIGGTSSAIYHMSADGGANWEAVTLNEVHRFSNTGTDLRVKVTMTNDTSDRVFTLKHYAMLFNIGAV